VSLGLLSEKTLNPLTVFDVKLCAMLHTIFGVIFHFDVLVQLVSGFVIIFLSEEEL
jgi:hypothetical protein